MFFSVLNLLSEKSIVANTFIYIIENNAIYAINIFNNIYLYNCIMYVFYTSVISHKWFLIMFQIQDSKYSNKKNINHKDITQIVYNEKKIVLILKRTLNNKNNTVDLFKYNLFLIYFNISSFQDLRYSKYSS